MPPDGYDPLSWRGKALIRLSPGSFRKNGIHTISGSSVDPDGAARHRRGNKWPHIWASGVVPRNACLGTVSSPLGSPPGAHPGV